MISTEKLIIDFDTHNWVKSLDTAIGHLLDEKVLQAIRTTNFRYREDPLEKITELAQNVDDIIDESIKWLIAQNVRIFHGTRFTDEEVEAVKKHGLQPLNKEARIDWLLTTIPEIGHSLPRQTAIDLAYQHSMGKREGEIHAALSRGLMFSGYDYLFNGSEFDRRLLQFANLHELLPLLTQRGKPRLVNIVLSGERVLNSAHPYFTIEDVRSVDRFPNLILEFLTEYAWQIYSPNSSCSQYDSCFLFREELDASCIEGIETIPNTK